MNGGRKRRIPVNVVAVSLLVLAISAVTAQQVFNGNGQTVFVRQQPQFQQQPQFPQNRNFVRQQLIPQQRRPQQFFVPRQQFRFQQPPIQQTRVRRPNNVPAFVRGGTARVVPMARPIPRQPAPQFAIRAPLSPIPFGAVQRRLPQNNMRLSLRPPTPPPTPPLLTTTTPLAPTSPIPTTTPQVLNVSSSQGSSQSLRRPIRVQQVSLDLRRKPQMTRGQFRRPHSPSNQKFPLIRHQATHRVKPDRFTRPIVSTTSTVDSTTTTPVITTTTEDEQRGVNHFKLVDDIEAAIVQAVIESSSPSSAPPTPSTHRPRRIRPGLRHRTTTPLPPAPLVDSIEEAVLRAVLEATTSTFAPEETTTSVVEEETVEDPTTETPTTTPKIEATSLFPAFASRRQTHRRRTTLAPTILTTPESTTIGTTEASTEEPTTSIFSTLNTIFTEEEPRTTTEETTIFTTSEDPSTITIAVPEDEEENLKTTKSEDHHIHQIEENVISAFPTSPSPPPSSSPSTFSPSSPAPPAPPAPPPTSSFQVGPPGSMPPSDDIVDELNGSTDFLQVAQRLHLLRRLLQ